MKSNAPRHSPAQTLMNRLVLINLLVCVIGSLLYGLDCLLVARVGVKATYVWLPLFCAVCLCVAASVVLTFLSLFASLRCYHAVSGNERDSAAKNRLVGNLCLSAMPMTVFVGTCAAVWCVLRN